MNDEDIELDSPNFVPEAAKELEERNFKRINQHSWIKIPKFLDDSSKTWEERYRALESHYEKETTFLIKEIERLKANERK